MHIKRIFGRLKDQFNSSLEAFTDNNSQPATPDQSVDRLSETRPAGAPLPGAYTNPASPPPPTRPAPEPGSNPLRGVVHSTPENTAYQQRSEQVQRIEAMFGGYGHTISSYLLTQSFTEGGVRRVVEKLSLSSRGRDGADLGQICQWIETHGTEEFCRRTNLRLKPQPAPAPDAGGSGTGEAEVRVRPLDLRTRQSSDSDSNREKMATGPRPRQMGPGETQPVNFEGARQKITVQPVGLDGKEIDRLRRSNANPDRASGTPIPPPVKAQDLPAGRPPSPIPDSDRGPQRSSAEVYLNQFLDEESSHDVPGEKKKGK